MLPNRCTRRQFGLALCGAPLSVLVKAAPRDPLPCDEPATVARVYLAAERPHWPKPTLDVAQEIAEIEARLDQAVRRHAGDARLIGGQTLRSAAEVRPWLEAMGDIDGVLMIPLTQPTPPLRPLIDLLEVPGLVFSRPYATHAWSSIAALQQAGRKVDVIATSSYGDLDPYWRAFRTARHLRKSKVLVGATEPGARKQIADAYQKHFGTTFQFVTGRQFVEAFEGVDPELARKATEEFVRGALRVVEPSPKEISNGVRFHLALAELLRRERANAIAIDCFGTMAANTLPGYPCIAFSKFNDAGLYGVCEADLHSAMTQMLITSYSSMPGFISDPVFDISRNEVIHAHCVAATRMKGPHAPPSPYVIRNHLETNEGAVLQVLMPAGETVTVARFDGPRRLLVSTAEATGAVESDRGCRSQIRTRVSDAAKWLRRYSAGLHRVVFYGDHTRDLDRLSRLLAFELVREI